MENRQTEHKLWESFRSGDEDAFVRLFHLFSDPLLHYGCSLTRDRALVKDSIQELLGDLWERGKGCPEVANVKAFLFTGLRRIILRRLQRDRRYLLQTDSEEGPGHSPESAQAVISAEAEMIDQENDQVSKDRLQKAVSGLPERQREAILLRYFHGLSYEEMAEVMAVKKGTIGRFIAQAITGLRKKMDRMLLLCMLMVPGFFFF